MSQFHAAMDFHKARRRASRERLLARLTGKSAQLLAFEEVRQMLKARIGRDVGLCDIPLDAIVGSVGRYSDFSRSFLPLQTQSEERWARVMTRVTEMGGLPPIQVYQIGEVYFVLDGNHRVSVARQLEASHIQAYVTQIESKVPLSPTIQPDELILKAEYAEFLEKTRLDAICPNADLSVTAPGQYPKFMEHIEVHRYFMGLDQQQSIPWNEAAKHWYETVYLPVIRVIREQDLLHDFPSRTEADLYLWASEHRAALEASLGWHVETPVAAADLAEERSPTLRHRVARLLNKIHDTLTPDELDGGPPPGAWRRVRLPLHNGDRLFSDILVSISGEEHAWSALDQALELAHREGARVLGLHVASSKEANEQATQAIEACFHERCRARQVAGEFAVAAGPIARRICERARWADLVVISLAHPPQPSPIAKLSSGLRTLIRRCETPILTVPGNASPIERLLLAYDGSPKAKEALYITTYLAAQRGIPVAVVSVMDSEEEALARLDEARAYLAAHNVEVTTQRGDPPAAQAILQAAQATESDLILMGGYGYSPVLEVILGSAVDRILREGTQPVLFCR